MYRTFTRKHNKTLKHIEEGERLPLKKKFKSIVHVKKPRHNAHMQRSFPTTQLRRITLQCKPYKEASLNHAMNEHRQCKHNEQSAIHQRLSGRCSSRSSTTTIAIVSDVVRARCDLKNRAGFRIAAVVVVDDKLSWWKVPFFW